MELKFRVKDFSKMRNMLKDSKLIDKRIEYYVYLKSSGKLQKMKGKFYFVSIKKKRNMFVLNYRKITRKDYNKIIGKSEIKRILTNKREIYKLERTQISFNTLEVGKFVILDGTKNYISLLAKKFGLKNPITKPFSDL